MDKNVLGRNYTFPIYKADGTSFHGLELKKATYDSVVMSLGDKITGDVYYRDNTLQFTMQEYIEFKKNPNDENEQSVKFVLVNPPTVVKEGLVGDNTELRGMTKYSFTFYHPMCQLSNLPFTDIAVSDNQRRYLSENKEFNWIGKPDDYIAKLNKNLEGTLWVAVKSERFPQEKDDELSEVLQFSNETIADALKKGYDTWGVPFVIDAISEGEYTYIDEHNEEKDYYSEQGGGKRFVILIGLPSNEIYGSDIDRQMDSPFVFRYGKGVGLKNNSRTPRNNKVITRISGYGSEKNVPFGYPQIIWTGNQDWDYTIDNDATNPLSYPIYRGIVGGQYVKLIKHPFTRNHLMPSIYTDCVNRKVNPRADGYDPTIELVDYYDAIGEDYPNKINLLAPSYESHEFDVKPELDSERELGIVSATPLNADLTPASTWDDTMDDDGNYLQSYFQITLPQLSFDVYACAAITEEMQINMRSGDCMGCTFTIQVDWDDYKRNFYDQVGNFVPNGEQRNLTKYPKSNDGQISVIVQKDNNTFGVLLPSAYQRPRGGDVFVILGISLPIEYIHDAEQRLDDVMKSYMLENNVYNFDYPLKFDEHYLATHTGILTQIRTNTIIHFEFADTELQLYVKQLTVKYGYGVLPQYEITLTDNIDVVLNQIGQVADDVERLGSLISILRQDYSRNVWLELAKKLSKTEDDVARGVITFLKGIAFGASQTWKIDGNGNAILNTINAQDAIFNTLTAQNAHFFTLIIDEIKSVGGQLIITAANCRIDYVEDLQNGDYKCYFKSSDGSRNINNQWRVGMQAIHMEFNVDSNGTRNYWRVVKDVSSDAEEVSFYDNDGNEQTMMCHWVVLCDYKHTKEIDGVTIGDSIPMAGDDLSQLGFNEAWCLAQPNGTLPSDYKQLENAIILSAYNIPFVYTGSYKGDANGIQAPLYAAFSGINDFVVAENNLMVGIAGNGHVFKGRVIIEQGSTLADGRDVNNLGVQEGNLLRNSGFTGDYESIEVDANLEMSEDTEVYSDSLKYWVATDAEGRADASAVEVIEESNAVSGYAATIDGKLSQDVDVYPDTWYMLMFKAYISDNTSGMLTINLGGNLMTKEVTYTTQRFALPIHTGDSVDNTDKKLVLSGENITVYDLMLVEGNIPTEYKPSEKDNDKALAELLGLEYLRKAIYEANTEIIGGLIMSQLIKVGNYVNGQQQNTGGMSGLYTDDNSPFLWGGGTFEQAIETIMYYASRRPEHFFDEEPEGHVNFAVTHGGRAILNDIVLRGWIHAIGGVFKNIHSPNYSFEIDEEGNVTLKGRIESNEGKIGGWKLSTEGLLSENATDITDVLAKWRNQSEIVPFAYLDDSTLLLQDVTYNYFGSTVATKIGIGKYSDPTPTGNPPSYNIHDSALYIYRRYSSLDRGFERQYYPAAIIISDNAGDGDVALHLGGALRVTGGVMEYGIVKVYGENNIPDGAVLLDLSVGTTYTFHAGWTEGNDMQVNIPNLAHVKAQLGIKSSDATTTFCVPVTIVNSSLSVKRIHIFMEADENQNRAHIRDNNGGYWSDVSSTADNIELIKGDSVELLITYLGGTLSDNYFAQVIRKND